MLSIRNKETQINRLRWVIPLYNCMNIHHPDIQKSITDRTLSNRWDGTLVVPVAAGADTADSLLGLSPNLGQFSALPCVALAERSMEPIL